MQPSTTPAERLAAHIPLLVTILLLVDSLHFVFARLLLPHMPPVASAFFVLAVATVETAVYLAATRRIQLPLLRRHWRFFATVGLLVAMATTLSYTAVRYIDPGTASLLSQTSTLFALALSILWLKERLTRGEMGGAAIAVLGIFIISFQPGDYLRLGSLIVLGSSFVYALHAAIVKRYGGGIEFGNFFLFRVASTTFFLALFNTIGGDWTLPPREAWIFLLLAGTFDVVISRVLYYLALRRLQMSHHAIVLMLSPVVAVIWSFLLFGTTPTAQGIIGGIAVLSGVLLVTISRQRALNGNR